MKLNVMLGSLLGTALLCGSLLFAQKPPAQDISGKHHPNLNAAQHLTEQAFNKITAAQQANEFDMNGHAAKAKDLLDQANRELKEAAEAANKNHK